MNNKEINEIIYSLSQTMYCFESLMIENEGEYTEEAAQLDEQAELLKELLTTEGVDSLGRWLKAKEDEVKSLKAEKDYITRKINAGNNTIDFIKYQMNSVLRAAGLEEIKGANGYKFKAITKQTTEVDKELLSAAFRDKVDEFTKTLPPYVKVTLGASVSLVPEGDPIPEFFKISESPSCTFSKPRASKKTE